MIVTAKSAWQGGIGRGEFWSFGRQVVAGRWFSLFASFLVMACAGGFYLFAYFSKDIKKTLKCDQTTLNKIGFYKDLGSNVGLFGGLLAEVVPSWFLMLLCAFVNFVGYFKIWQAVAGKIIKPTVAFFCFYITVGGNSQNLANTVVLVGCVKNFPERRGVILGLLKGFLGLGGAILAQIYFAIYGHNDTKSLILFIAWFPALITLIFTFTIREMKVVKHPNEFRVFVQFLCITVILAFFLTVLIFIQKRVQFDQFSQLLVVIAILGLLFLPLLISIREEMVQWNLQRFTKVLNPQAPKTPLTEILSSNSSSLSSLQTQNPNQSDSFFSNIFNKPERGEDYTILQAIFSIDMLILYLTMIIGIGSSFTAMDNLAQIGESNGYTDESINSLISIVSIFNFAGRIFSGFVSEILLEKYKFPRPLMLTLTLLVSCIGHYLVAFPFHNSLYITSIIIGFSLGSQIPLYFAMISELFGLKHYSMLYNFGQLSCPIGTYILNVLVAGKLYDDQAVETPKNSGEFKCIGEHCYKESFIILTVLTLIGAAISMILVKRTREFYSGDIYKKFREDMDSLKKEVERYPVEKKNQNGFHIEKQSTDTSMR